MAHLARRHPDLPFIYASPGYRDRNLLAAVRDCPNLSVTIGAPFAANLGIEEICRNFGPDRLLFSSNYPVSEPGAVVAYLMYADVSDEAVELIAHGNLKTLVEGVRNG